MDYFNYFREGLKLIPSCLWKFLKNLFVNGFVYGIFHAIPMAIAFGVSLLVKAVSQNADAATLTLKILLTIGQIIPLTVSLYMSENELIDTDEDSAELCFVFCAAVIAYIWTMH